MAVEDLDIDLYFVLLGVIVNEMPFCFPLRHRFGDQEVSLGELEE